MIQDAWNRFWFLPIDARQYALLRIAFGVLTAIYFLSLLPYLKTQFAGGAWLGDIRQISVQNGGSWSLFFLSAIADSDYLAYAIVWLGIFSGLMLAIGWQSRWHAGICWLVWVSLWNRNPLILDGDDAVLKVMCFYLLLSPCGNSWSIDAYRENKPQSVAVWPLRLMQFQICLLYFVSGWVKFHSQEWLNGDILGYVLIHPHYSRWDGWLIIDNLYMKALLMGLAFSIRWWELLFPILLLNAYSRAVCLWIGTMFHFGLLLTMHLRWFPVIMLCLYPALWANCRFIEFEQKILKIYQFLLCFFRKLRS